MVAALEVALNAENEHLVTKINVEMVETVQQLELEVQWTKSLCTFIREQRNASRSITSCIFRSRT